MVFFGFDPRSSLFCLCFYCRGTVQRTLEGEKKLRLLIAHFRDTVCRLPSHRSTGIFYCRRRYKITAAVSSTGNRRIKHRHTFQYEKRPRENRPKRKYRKRPDPPAELKTASPVCPPQHKRYNHYPKFLFCTEFATSPTMAPKHLVRRYAVKVTARVLKWGVA